VRDPTEFEPLIMCARAVVSSLIPCWKVEAARSGRQVRGSRILGGNSMRLRASPGFVGTGRDLRGLCEI